MILFSKVVEDKKKLLSGRKYNNEILENTQNLLTKQYETFKKFVILIYLTLL